MRTSFANAGLAVGPLSALAFTVPVYAADSLAATWTLNLAKSTYNPGPAPKSGTSTFEAVAGGIKLTNSGVDADGKATHLAYTAKFDGKDYPVTGSPTQDSVVYKKIDDYTYENIAKKGRKVTTTARMSVARDGKTRTNTVTGADTQGRTVNSTMVYDRR
jgi:hypothetical protein